MTFARQIDRDRYAPEEIAAIFSDMGETEIDCHQVRDRTAGFAFVAVYDEEGQLFDTV